MDRKVLIPTKLERVAKDTLTAHGGYVVIQDEKTPLLQQAALHPDTYALIVRSEPVDAAVLDAFANLKVVVRAGAGFNTIDTKHARRKGVDVMNTPGANANAVAEEVVAMILADVRHVVKADPSTRAGKWEKNKFMGRELAGKTVGIVGLGNIGRLLARRLAGFDCSLLGYDPVISKERAEEMDVALVPLEALFEKSDFVSLHIPENDETRGIVDEALLSRMKEGATVVNCARSGIVNEDALRKVKAQKKIRYLTDVYPKDEEGPKPVADIADLMMPHLGASTYEANGNAARRAAEQLVDLAEKGVTSYIVNRDIPEGLDEAYCSLAHLLAKLARCLVGRGIALKQIETSFCGRLEPFADWLLVPIVAGIWEDFDRSTDFRAARTYLADMGIEYTNRTADRAKGHGESITVDLIGEVDADSLRQLSVRGTVAEGNMMVARINEFDKLYFEPAGPTLFFLYDDRPGVIGAIGMSLAHAGINIEDMRNPHDGKTNRSLAILRVNRPAPEALVDEISRNIRALSAFSIVL